MGLGGSAALAKGEIRGARVSVRDSDEAEVLDYCGPERRSKSKSGSPAAPAPTVPAAAVPSVALEESVVAEVGEPGCVVSIAGLPAPVTVEEIGELFGGFPVLEDSIRLRYDADGRPSGDCLLALKVAPPFLPPPSSPHSAPDLRRTRRRRCGSSRGPS